MIIDILLTLLVILRGFLALVLLSLTGLAVAVFVFFVKYFSAKK